MAPPPGRSPRGTSSSAARAGTRHAVTSHARSTARRRPRREHPTPDPPMRDHAAMGTGRQQLRPHTRDTPRLDATRYSTSPTPVNAHCTRSLRNSSPRTTLLRRVARMRAAGAGSGIHARTAHTKYAHASPRPRWLRPRLRGVHPTSHVQIPRHGLCGRFKHPGAGAHKKCTLAAKPSKIRPGGRGAPQPH